MSGGSSLRRSLRVSAEGAVHFVCMDWRHISDLIDVGRKLYGAMLNFVVWNKSNAGQGSFYRSQHELIGVFRAGENPHRNNVDLGRFGRNRSNVWTYPGVNAFGRDRLEAIAAHPTVKPVALVADALLDCTARGEGVLDQFAGSGTTILAAEKVGRIGFGIEYEPGYVRPTGGLDCFWVSDVAINQNPAEPEKAQSSRPGGQGRGGGHRPPS
jgi:DNA modification methylase